MGSLGQVRDWLVGLAFTTWWRPCRWSACSASCGGGVRHRTRVCVEKEGRKETCFGNWHDPEGKYEGLKRQSHKCNQLACPGNCLIIVH